MSRWMLGVAGIAVAVMGAWQGDDLAAVVAGLDARVTAVEDRLAGRTVGEHVPQGLTFSGTDATVSEPFDLKAGGVIVAVDAPAKANRVELVPAPGNESTLPVYIFQGAWPYVGTSAHTVTSAGRYVLTVDAVGAWSVVIEQ